MKEKFEFNPFAGVLEEDLEQIIVPVFDIDAISNQIECTDSLAIEFIGKQGRGKTTHLRYLQKQLNSYPIFLLTKTTANLSNILEHDADVVFVDSIHHLSVFERLQLFKAKRVVIYTTHWSRKYTCVLINKKYYSIPFKGITVAVLRSIIDKRLRLASNNSIHIDDVFVNNDLQLLIKKFGDSYRGILNYLYEQYQ
ncbi:hypothetical protein [uncultured Dokdonia sp.]|uniref:hypothetical protein n=1 Tax=uncultured Dokdonia sp. TaxID=575653 RepID=UPI00261605F3|nr:hypothetical protein [uncultured Dokdonia sp.]